MTSLNSLNRQYSGLIEAASMPATLGGCTEWNKRTGAVIHCCDGPQHIKHKFQDSSVTRPVQLIPVLGNRRYSLKVASAEAAWQAMGTRDASFIMQHAPKLWKKFLVASTGGEIIEAAYGWRWQSYFGTNQIEVALRRLSEDPTCRQVWVSAWDPMTDMENSLREPPMLNIPCPVGFGLNIIANKLNMTVMIRSSDMLVGLPYDMLCYMLTLDMLKCELVKYGLAELRLGTIHFTMAHAHYYEAQREVAMHMLSLLHCEVPILHIDAPGWAWRDVVSNPFEYVKAVTTAGLWLYSRLPKDSQALWTTNVEVIV